MSDTTVTWVYQRTEPTLWTVGFYAPNGTWHIDSDHGSSEDAAARVHWLNGGQPPTTISSEDTES